MYTDALDQFLETADDPYKAPEQIGAAWWRLGSAILEEVEALIEEVAKLTYENRCLRCTPNFYPGLWQEEWGPRPNFPTKYR